MPAEHNRRDLILQSAEALMRRVGFRAFSYQDLAERVGISKPAIHHHFRTKEALGLALIELYDRHFRSIVERVRAVATTPGAQLFAFLWLEEEPSSSCEICPLGALQVHFETFPESMRRASVDLAHRVYNWLSENLEQARVNREVHSWGTAREQAVFLMSSLQGARQQTRALGAEVFSDVCRCVERALFVNPDSYRPKGNT